MADAKELAQIARTTLAQALDALQSSPDVPESLMEIAAPVAKSMGILRKIERTDGAQLEGAAEALKNIRSALDSLQAVEEQHPSVDLAMDAVASSLGKLLSLNRMALNAAKDGQAPKEQPQAPRPASQSQPAPAQQQAAQQQAAQQQQAQQQQAQQQAAQQQAQQQAAQQQAAQQQAAQQQAQQQAAQQQAQQQAAQQQAAQQQAQQQQAAQQQAQQQAAQQQAAQQQQQAAQQQAQQQAAQQQAAQQQAQQQAAQQQVPAQPQPAQPTGTNASAFSTVALEPPFAGTPSAGPSGTLPDEEGQPGAQDLAATQIYGGPSGGQAPPAEKTPQDQAAADTVVAQRVPGSTDAPVPPSGSLPVNVELGAYSASNFYKGLSGNDVIEHGGVFVQTYVVLKMGTAVRLRMLFPGDLEFEADVTVQWTRETQSGDTEPGFGAKFTRISQEGRQLVYRYVRNREPMFYDDF